MTVGAIFVAVVVAACLLLHCCVVASIGVVVQYDDGSAQTIGVGGANVTVTWERQNDGSFVDRIAVLDKYAPCELLSETTFAVQHATGSHALQLPVGNASLPASYSIHVFKNSTNVTLTSPCAWTDLAGQARGSVDVTAMTHSAFAFSGVENGALTWAAPVVGEVICNGSSHVPVAARGFAIEMWVRCAGDCVGQVLLDSSPACARWRVRIVAEQQLAYGPTDTPELDSFVDPFFSRNAHSYVCACVCVCVS